MLKHIVMWKLAPEADGYSRQQNAERIKAALENLQGHIPGLLEIEVGINCSKSADAYDVVLYSVFTDQEALDAYFSHPAHQAVIPLVQAVREGRVLTDYVV